MPDISEKAGKALVKNRIDVNYNALTAAPFLQAEKLADALKLSYGLKTKDVLAGVRPSQAPPNPSFLETIDNDLKEEIISLYHACGKAA